MSVSASETATPEELTARDPATGAVLGSVMSTAPEQVEEVVEAVAKVQPLWALLRVQDRARYMGRMAQAVIDDFDELQEGLAREQGRPRAEIAALELLAAIDALRWIAEDGADVLGGRRVGINRSMTLAKRASIAFEPYGVLGVIGAGSAPFAQPLGQIAGALLAGNGVIFKPAARASLAGERIARVLARAGLPEGLVRVVHGAADVGVALAQSPVEQDPVHRLASRRAGGGAGVRVAREGGHGGARRQGRDARARRRAPAARGRRRAVGGLRRRRAGARVDRARVRRARGLRALPRRARQRRARADASATRPTRACRSARWPPRAGPST